MANTNVVAREIAVLDVCMHLEREAEESLNTITLRIALNGLAIDLKQSADTLAATTDASTRRLADRIDAFTVTTDRAPAGFPAGVWCSRS